MNTNCFCNCNSTTCSVTTAGTTTVSDSNTAGFIGYSFPTEKESTCPCCVGYRTVVSTTTVTQIPEKEVKEKMLDINEEIDQEGLSLEDIFRQHRDELRRKVQRLNDEAEELRNIADSKERRAHRIVTQLNEETPIPDDK